MATSCTHPRVRGPVSSLLSFPVVVVAAAAAGAVVVAVVTDEASSFGFLGLFSLVFGAVVSDVVSVIGCAGASCGAGETDGEMEVNFRLSCC